MTGSAQTALRRTMERYSKTTRFCLICNYITRIIPPVASRCAKFRFGALPKNSMMIRLMQICKSENLEVEEETCNALIEIAKGDLRKCINLLQSAKQLSDEGPITVEDVKRVSVYVEDSTIQDILRACQAPRFDTLSAKAKQIILDGHPISLVFERLCNHVTQLDSLSDHQKARICLSISRSDSALCCEGADEVIQLQKVFSVLSKVL